MKSYCIQCKRRIDPLDFYMDTKQGKICSSCLVEAQPDQQLDEQMQSLFWQPKSANQLRLAAQQQAEKLKAMSSEQLRYGLS